MTDTVLLSSSTTSSTGNSSRSSSNTSVPTTNMDDTTTKKVVEDTNNNNKNHTKSSCQRQESQIDSDHNNENDLIKNDQSIVTNADSNQTMNGQQPIDIDDDDDDDHNDNDENENSKAMMNDNVVVVHNEQQIGEEIEEEDEEDDDDVIDDEQVNEFKEQLQSLGNYPDKVMINTLSMIATDYQDSFKSVQKLYSTWKLCLLQKQNTSQHSKIHEMMPIIYVLDSILKNVPGKLFRTMVEKDYTSWLPSTYHNLPTIQQQKLYKVYVTWKEYNIFTSMEKWKEIGTSFLHSSTTGVGTSSTTNNTSSTTNMVTTRETNSDMIIPRNQKDGTLILAKNLRQEMQNILDDIQQQQQGSSNSDNNGGDDELNKVSLERLADINPTLLYNIKKAAEDGLKLAATSSISSSTLQQQPTSTSMMMMHRDSKHTVTTTSSSLLLNKRNNATNTNTTNNTTTSITPSFIIETRTMDTVQRSNEWYTVLLQQPSTHTLSSNGGSSSTHHNTTTPSSTSTATDALVNSITKSIEQMIHNGCCTETEEEQTNHDTKLYTQKDAVLMTKYYATGSAISQLLVLSLQQQQQQSVNHQTNAVGSTHSTTTSTTTSANHRTVTNHSNDNTSSSASSSLIYTTNFFKVNQINIDDFTTEGIKPKKAITISLLYEIGLPYQSTIDGKRFRTEQQLSKHLDYIFQQKVLSSSSLLNTTTTSKERGWYIHDQIWTKEIEEIQHDPVSSMTSNPNVDDTNQSFMDVTMTTTDPDQLYTVVADESRDTCVICGRRFIMYFDDSQEGQYKYRNCISIPMKGQNDEDDDEDDLDHDVGLDEDDNDDDHNANGTNKVLQPQLIHGTCWIGLGQPETISYDQTIYINKEQ